MCHSKVTCSSLNKRPLRKLVIKTSYWRSALTCKWLATRCPVGHLKACLSGMREVWCFLHQSVFRLDSSGSFSLQLGWTLADISLSVTSAMTASIFKRTQDQWPTECRWEERSVVLSKDATRSNPFLIRKTQQSLQDLLDLTVTAQEQGNETVCFLFVKPNHLKSTYTSGNTYLYNEGTVYVCVHALLRFPSQIIQTWCLFHSKRQCLHEMNNNVFVSACIWVFRYVLAQMIGILNDFVEHTQWQRNVSSVEKNTIGLSNYLAVCLQNFYSGLEALEDLRV